MDLEKARIDYERDGVALIPDVFTKQETDFIRVAALGNLNGSDTDKPYRSGQRLQGVVVNDFGRMDGQKFRHQFPAILFWPVLGKKGEYLNFIRTDERTSSIVRWFLGDDVKQLNNQVYYRMPGDGDAFNWHQDVMFRKGLAEGHSIAEDYLQTVIVVDEMDGYNAPLIFQKGSHRWMIETPILKDRAMLRTQPASTIWPKDRNFPIKANAGDVLIWNVMTIHGSLPNTSTRPRMTYMNGFCRARSSEAWPWYLKNGKVQQADPELIPYT